MIWPTSSGFQLRQGLLVLGLGGLEPGFFLLCLFRCNHLFGHQGAGALDCFLPEFKLGRRRSFAIFRPDMFGQNIQIDQLAFHIGDRL